MKKVKLYTIQGNTKDYSDFLEINYCNVEKCIQVKAMHEQNWKPFDMEKFVIPEFELARSDTGKKISSMIFLLMKVHFIYLVRMLSKL